MSCARRQLSDGRQHFVSNLLHRLFGGHIDLDKGLSSLSPTAWFADYHLDLVGPLRIETHRLKQTVRMPLLAQK